MTSTNLRRHPRSVELQCFHGPEFHQNPQLQIDVAIKTNGQNN